MTKRIMLQPSPLSSGAMGSTLKCLGIGRVLRSIGCEVSFVIGGKLKNLLEREGFQCYDFPLPVTRGTQQDIRSLVDFMEWSGLTDADFARTSVQTEINAIKDFKPDAIFSETRLSSVISAKACNVPIMSIAAWPRHPDFPANIPDYGRNVSTFNKLLDQYGMKKVNHLAELLFLRSDMKISPSIPILEPELSQVPDISYMGYVLDIDVQKKAPDNERYEKDIILVYFSVGAISPRLYHDVIIETFGGMKEKVIVSCGYHYELQEGWTSNYQNIQFVPYINLTDIVHRIKLILFHGGQDTMMLSLLFGIPSITIPGKHFEREYNSAALARLGVSEQLPVHGFRVNRLKKAVKDCCSTDRAEKCIFYRQKMAEYKGTQFCAEQLLSLCQ